MLATDLCPGLHNHFGSACLHFSLCAIGFSDSPLLRHLKVSSQPAWQLGLFDPNTCTSIHKQWCDLNPLSNTYHTLVVRLIPAENRKLREGNVFSCDCCAQGAFNMKHWCPPESMHHGTGTHLALSPNRDVSLDDLLVVNKL